MYQGNDIGWTAAEAERAFDKAVRARRRASVARHVLRRCVECAQLVIHDAHRLVGSAARGGVRDIPLAAITGSLEPHRAAQLDREFCPAPSTRGRRRGLWAPSSGRRSMPPISLAAVGNAYAIRDGHHRVSVARARGALTITAIVA